MWLTRPFPTHTEPIRDSTRGSRSFQPATVGGRVRRSPECTPAQTSRGIFYQSPWQHISSLPSPGGTKGDSFISDIMIYSSLASFYLRIDFFFFFWDDYFPVRPLCFRFVFFCFYVARAVLKKIIPISKASSKCLRSTWAESNVSRFL